MVRQHQKELDGGAAAFNSTDIPFEHRDFGTAQLQQIFSCRKTTLFEEIIPQLEELGGIYREGNRVKATGHAILALRARKLREGRQPRPRPKNHHEKRGNRKAGAP